jgi:hypothetical protein
MTVHDLLRSAVAIGLAIAGGGCGISPVGHRINLGQEPFVVFVGTGVDGHTDLFAARAGGDDAVQFTFTSLVESSPRVRPDGEVVAFLRTSDSSAASAKELVLMNLVTSGETDIALPAEARTATALAWSRDTAHIYIQTSTGWWQVDAPPGPPHPVPVAAGDTASVDSLFVQLLGTPAYARAINCPGGGVCIIGPHGDTSTLAPRGRNPIRWGDDSLAWMEDSSLMVRSLGPGIPHKVTWRHQPKDPREMEYVPDGRLPHTLPLENNLPIHPPAAPVIAPDTVPMSNTDSGTSPIAHDTIVPISAQSAPAMSPPTTFSMVIASTPMTV